MFSGYCVPPVDTSNSPFLRICSILATGKTAKWSRKTKIYLSKQSCSGSSSKLLLWHILKTKYPKWLVVISMETSIHEPVLYSPTTIPVLPQTPPGASCCLGSALKASPQIPHWPSHSFHWTLEEYLWLGLWQPSI